MENDDKPQRRNWDLMIGIALVLFGSLQLYNRMKTQTDIDFRTIFTIVFIGYGGYLIYRHLQGVSKK